MLLFLLCFLVSKVMNKRQSQVHPRITNNMAIEYRDDAEDPPIDTHIFTTNPDENTVTIERDVTPSTENISVKRSRSEPTERYSPV